MRAFAMPSRLPRLLLPLLVVAAPLSMEARELPFAFLGEPVFIDGIGVLQFEPTHFYRFVDAEKITVTVLLDVSTRKEKNQHLGRVWVVEGNQLRPRRRLSPGGDEETAVVRYLESAIKNFWDRRSATNLEDDRGVMVHGLHILRADRARRSTAAPTEP